LLQLVREHRLQPWQIARIVVHCAPHTARLVGSHRVAGVLDAQMSLPYTLAVTARSGRADLPQFDPPQTADPEIARLMAATELVADLPADHAQGPRVALLLADGRTVQAQVAVAKGDPRLPVSDEELHAKAQSLIEPVLGAQAFARITRGVARLEQLADFNELAQLLSPA
jgi:2-methylcitrate dehydratase PrpD